MGNYGLSVIDGDLKYTDPSGAVIDVPEAGGGSFCVNFVFEDMAWKVDKTLEEVEAAYESGTFIYGTMTVSDRTYMIEFAGEVTGAYDFKGIMFDGDDMTVGILTMYDNSGATGIQAKTTTYDLSTLK